MYIGEYNCLKEEYELDIIIKQECEKYWKISDVERENCKEKLRKQLPMLRGAVGTSQVDIANAIGISRQTYNAIESGKKEMNWTIYCSLLLYFDYHPNAHTIIHQLNIFPSWLESTQLYTTTICENNSKEI